MRKLSTSNTVNRLRVRNEGRITHTRPLKRNKNELLCYTTILEWAKPRFKNPEESILKIPKQLYDVDGKHLRIKNEEFVALMQTLINSVPSINSTSNRYMYLDNLFKEDFNVKPRDVNGYITYESFVKLVVTAQASQTTLAGVYPVGNNPNGYTHYYIVLPTSYIPNRDEFINWFSSRGERDGYNQNRNFVSRSLENPFVILNGCIKGASPLDMGYKDKVGHFSLGANIQPAQALCAFNAVILGLAFGLPAYQPFISTCALRTCHTLQPGSNFNRETYTYNERQVLTFLSKVLYATTKGPFETEISFLTSLVAGSRGGDMKDYDTGKAKALLLTLKNASGADFLPVASESGINMISIFKIILCPHFTPQFNYWSETD